MQALERHAGSDRLRGLGGRGLTLEGDQCVGGIGPGDGRHRRRRRVGEFEMIASTIGGDDGIDEDVGDVLDVAHLVGTMANRARADSPASPQSIG